MGCAGNPLMAWADAPAMGASASPEGGRSEVIEPETAEAVLGAVARLLAEA